MIAKFPFVFNLLRVKQLQQSRVLRDLFFFLIKKRANVLVVGSTAGLLRLCFLPILTQLNLIGLSVWKPGLLTNWKVTKRKACLPDITLVLNEASFKGVSQECGKLGIPYLVVNKKGFDGVNKMLWKDFLFALFLISRRV